MEAKLLKAAQYLADSATQLDAAKGTVTPHRRNQRQSLVIGSVLTSVAFLEATLDAIWDDCNLNGLPKSWFRHRGHLAPLAKLGVSHPKTSATDQV
jgi:hypothetical protein